MSIKIIKGYRLKSCPCGNKNVYLTEKVSEDGEDICTYYIVCTNPMCHWTFNFTDCTDWYKSDQEAQTNGVNAWNKRKLDKGVIV